MPLSVPAAGGGITALSTPIILVNYAVPANWSTSYQSVSTSSAGIIALAAAGASIALVSLEASANDFESVGTVTTSIYIKPTSVGSAPYPLASMVNGSGVQCRANNTWPVNLDANYTFDYRANGTYPVGITLNLILVGYQ